MTSSSQISLGRVDKIKDHPRQWTVTLEANRRFELSTDDLHFRRLKSRMENRKAKYETLFEGEITKEESAVIYKVAVETLENFRFVEPDSMAMDGSTMSIELAAFRRAMKVTFS